MSPPIVQFAPRQPLPPLALAFGTGVALASLLPWESGRSLSLVAFAVVLGAIAGSRTRSHSPIWLLAAAVLSGAVRCDWSRSNRDAHQSLQPTEERRLVRLRGTIARAPISDPADEPSPLRPTHQPNTRVRIEVESKFHSDGWRPAAGLVDGTVPEKRSALRRGDKVEAFGWLFTPSPPKNPGEFDYAARLKRQGVVGLLTCETPSAVLLLETGSEWSLLRMRDRLLESCRDRLQRWMPMKEAGVAEAAVLGARTSIRREDLEPWVNSGTLHLLVVSGWHVAVVAAAAWSIGRFLVHSRRRRAVGAMLAVWAYTVLTGSEAPAVRAAVFTSVVLCGVMLGRPFQPLNALAAGVLVLLVADPQQLFHTGAQLSVLAVMGLLIFPQKLVGPLPLIDPELGQSHSMWRRWRHGLLIAFVASFCAWAATAPLVAHQFHLFSPASIWLSVILAPILVAAIGCSVMVLLLADFYIAAPFAWTADACIKVLNNVVAFSEWLPGGFSFCIGPPLWWLAAVAFALWIPFIASPRWSAGRLHAAAMVCLSIAGAFFWSKPATATAPAFHQLAVGHGNAAVLQTGRGRTFLIDCGSMTVPGVGERIAAPFLWTQGVQTIDAVFISHADVDHFNGLPALLSRFRIGAVFAPPQFARMEQPGVRVVADALLRKGVPLHFTWAGDRATIDDVELEMLWPTHDARGTSDNSNSLVVDIQSQRRRVLSTGDLAEEGLRTVLGMERPTVEVLVMPHHGGRSCNPPELAKWARPAMAVASQHGRSGDSTEVYREFGAFTARTDVDGAFSAVWHGGDLLLTTFRTGREIRLCK